MSEKRAWIKCDPTPDPLTGAQAAWWGVVSSSFGYLDTVDREHVVEPRSKAEGGPVTRTETRPLLDHEWRAVDPSAVTRRPIVQVHVAGFTAPTCPLPVVASLDKQGAISFTFEESARIYAAFRAVADTERAIMETLLAKFPHYFPNGTIEEV